MQSEVGSRGCGAWQGRMPTQPTVARAGTHRALRWSIGTGRPRNAWTPCHGNAVSGTGPYLLIPER
jgi:hypothetical protein